MTHGRPHKAFVVVTMTSDNEPSFDDFDTYEEALAACDETDYKAWIIGPNEIEDHS